MALSEVQVQVLELYIATFNRAPDIAGLNYWVDMVAREGWSVANVSLSMLESQEAQTIFSLELSNQDFINTIYQNVLGRASDDVGLAYWLEQMNNGLSKSNMILTIINGAKATTGSKEDKDYLSNRKDFAEYFTFEKALNDTSLAKSLLAYVNSDPESVNYAKDRIDFDLYLQASTPNLISLDDNPNIYSSLDGNYIIYSRGGNDNITLGTGSNLVVAGAGADTVYGGSGDDTIKLRGEDDTAYGGAGADTIYGDSGNDNIFGEAGDDFLYGGYGDDHIYGGAGNDTIYGDEGDDFIDAGAGNDTIYGGDGEDTIYTEDGNNFVDGGAGNDTIYAGIGDDFLYGGAGNDLINAGAGNDTVDGGAGDDTIYGGAGDDTIYGSAGSDTLYGGAGNDKIDGGIGDDKIYAELGADILTGGLGKDRFYFSSLDSTLTSMDTIMDFEYSQAGYDKFVLVNQGTKSINPNKTDVSAASNLTDAANILSSEDCSIDTNIGWFIFEGDTYLVQDLSSSSTFDNTTDIIIKLQGIVDLTGLNTSSIEFI